MKKTNKGRKKVRNKETKKKKGKKERRNKETKKVER
jgi:hypothetical protein